MLIACACSEKPDSATEMAPSEKVDPAPAAPAAPAPRPAPAGPVTVRCGDLMTADDLNAAGVDPTSYDPDKTAAPGLGVNCVVGSLSVTLFQGDQYESMIDGAKTMGPQNGLSLSEGPSVGSANQWTVMGAMNGLMFQSTNRRYAANLSGTDKVALERLARTIDGRMSRH